MKRVTLAIWLAAGVKAAAPKHGPGGHSKKKWLEFTKDRHYKMIGKSKKKLYTGGKCIFDTSRTDCGVCSKNGCPCYRFHKNRCFDCKDERICYADGNMQNGYVFWTKEPTGCECEWNRKAKAKECACCYPGGKQCKVADFKDRCIGPDDDWRLCSQPKKIKMREEIDWTEKPSPPSKTKFTAVKETVAPTSRPTGFLTPKPPKRPDDKPQTTPPPRPTKDEHDVNDHDHDDNEPDDHGHPLAGNPHGLTSTTVALQIPIGKPQQAIIDKVMKDMELAFKKKKPSKIEQTIESCNPNLPVYIPLFYMPQFESHSSGAIHCQDPFWLSLRHGGPQTRLVVQTRRNPKDVDPTEQGAMQACIDVVVQGDTVVLGYVDADFENRLMTDILADISAWAEKFKNMSGIYMDPVGIQLRGNHLDVMLRQITDFIRQKMKLPFPLIVFNPASDFYDF